MAGRITSFPTPLVRLGRFLADGTVYLKAEHLQPTGSIYDRIAGAILEARTRTLAPGSVVVVAGSGSLALSFAAHAARFGVELVAVFPASTLPEHKKLLEGHKVGVVYSDAEA